MTSRATAAEAVRDGGRSQLLRLMSGFVVTQAIRCAAELGIADALESGPQSVETLAERTACRAAHIERLLSALCHVGVFRRTPEGFGLTPLGDWLRVEREGTLRPAASFFGNEMYRALAALPSTMRTGRPGAESGLGATIWSYLDEHSDRGKVFDDMLASLNAPEIDAVVAAYDFSWARSIVDVGGGDGALLRAILARHAQARGTLLESESVIERLGLAASRCAHARLEVVPGSFFDAVPRGHGIYVLKHVLHDWDDAAALRILETCRDALTPSARMLVIEALLDGGRRMPQVAWMNLGVAAAFGGKERSFREYRSLCRRAGLEVRRLVHTRHIVSIVELARADAPRAG